MLKPFAFLLIPISAGLLFAQQQPDIPPDTETPADTTSNPVTLAHPDEQSPNYFNFFLFANGVYDSTSPIFEAGQPQSSSGSSGLGLDVGGGVTGVHQFAGGSFALSYRGGYRDYQSSAYPSGTDQNLSFVLTKRLGRRWTTIYSQSAGIFLYGGTYFAVQPVQAIPIVTNPFATETKFLQSSVTVAYQQTLRLSYEFSGSFYLTRYNAPGAYGATGAAGSGSALYRFTRRTTGSATYSHTAFDYQNRGGSSAIDSVYLTVSHDFNRSWRLGVSGGVSHTDASGVVTVPFELAIGPELVTGYVTGPFHQASTAPYFQGTITRNWLHSQLSITGGQTITAGNGFFLSARDLGVSGFYSYSFQKSSLGFGGAYAHLSSVSNSAGTYSSSSFSASYGYNLMRHIGLNLRYDHLTYGNFAAYPGLKDNRVSVGIVFNSKNVPITLF